MINEIDCITHNSSDSLVTPSSNAGLPPNVLKILTEVDCLPPTEVWDCVDKTIQLIKIDKSLAKAKLLIFAGTVLVIGMIVTAVFGQLLISISLGILGMALTAKALNILKAGKNLDAHVIDKYTDKIISDTNLIASWMKKINATKSQNDLTSEQLKALNEAFSYGKSKLINLKAVLP